MEFIGSDMYRGVFVKYRIITFEVLCPYGFGCIQCTIFSDVQFLDQIFMIAACLFGHKVREGSCDRQGMCRHIKFRNDVDTHGSAVFNERTELLFCIVCIF